jgi:fumarate reductase subunit C
MSARRPYRRPMQGWWRKNPWFMEYMLHEATAVFVALYAFILLAGLICLAGGRGPWEAWVAWLRTPWSVGLHLIILVAMLYHAWTWFHIMPRTLPPIRVRGAKVAGETITRAGLAATLAASVGLLVFAWWLGT